MSNENTNRTGSENSDMDDQNTTPRHPADQPTGGDPDRHVGMDQRPLDGSIGGLDNPDAPTAIGGAGPNSAQQAVDMANLAEVEDAKLRQKTGKSYSQGQLVRRRFARHKAAMVSTVVPVSYTHLTLPTKA